jgi:hypothetical protein
MLTIAQVAVDGVFFYKKNLHERKRRSIVEGAGENEDVA